jgi:hypothetical protein
MDAAELERSLVERSVGGDGPELAGPVHVLDTAEGVDGRSTYQVSASHLVPVDDDDPELAGVSIAVPVMAAVEVDGEGVIVGIDVPDDPESKREAQSFTRNLIARGEVTGLASGGRVRRGWPPTRATHEVTVDEFGRRVIRRTGFSATGAPPAPPTAPSTLDAPVHDGDIERDHDIRRGGTR